MESHGDLECTHTSKGLSGGQYGFGRTPCDLRTQDARLVGSGHEAISHWPPYLPWEAVVQVSPRLPGSAKEWGLLVHPCCPLPPNTGAACSHAQLHSSLGWSAYHTVTCPCGFSVVPFAMWTRIMANLHLRHTSFHCLGEPSCLNLNGLVPLLMQSVRP